MINSPVGLSGTARQTDREEINDTLGNSAVERPMGTRQWQQVWYPVTISHNTEFSFGIFPISTSG